MNVPEIRFRGFDGEWKNKKFNEIVDRISKHSKDKSLPCVEFEDIEAGKGLLNKDIFAKDTHKNGVQFSPDDVLFGKLRPYLKNILLAKFKGIAVGDFWVLRTKENVPYFLYTFVNSKRFMDVANISSGSKMPRADWNIVSNSFFAFPQIPEQRTISSFFQNIDSQIEVTGKKITMLRQLKEASLQSMFPAEGETVPKVRFKGFKGEWEKIQADKIFETCNERNRPDLPVLSAFQDIRGMAIRGERGYEISHDKKNEVTYKIVRPGQFVIHLRSFQGGFAHSSVMGITSPAYTVFGFKEEEKHDDYFWKIIFMSKSFVKRLEAITYGIRDGRSISYSEFSKLEFCCPSKNEQRAIASFFRNLDRQINIYTQRLELINRIETACLEKMFVQP